MLKRAIMWCSELCTPKSYHALAFKGSFLFLWIYCFTQSSFNMFYHDVTPLGMFYEFLSGRHMATVSFPIDIITNDAAS